MKVIDLMKNHNKNSEIGNSFWFFNNFKMFKFIDFKNEHLGFLEKFIDLYENIINSLQRSERDLHVAIARLMEMLNLMTSYL